MMEASKLTPFRYVTQPLDTIKTRYVRGTFANGGERCLVPTECNRSKHERNTRTALLVPLRYSEMRAF